MPLIPVKKDKIALVINNSLPECQLLTTLLDEYDVHIASDSISGVAIYVELNPDIVLMDLDISILDNHETAIKIKKLQKNNLSPLIFLAKQNTEEAFIKGMDAGGDAVLIKPFSPELFKAKIKSMQRIGDLYKEVSKLQQIQEKDAELAQQLMSGVIESQNYGLDKISIVKQPAEVFSGDIQLTALAPNGDINIMLGDFTGHGLRASIGAIPLAQTFRVMTTKGFSLLEIITQINSQLNQLLPTGLFLAATFVSISNHQKTAYIFNAGLPETYIFNGMGEIIHKLMSVHPPLAILPKLLPEAKLTVLPVQPKDHIVLISDGILEARNLQGEMFDYQGFEQSVKEGMQQGNIAEVVMKHVSDFCQNAMQEDDISLIDIPCGGWDEVRFPEEKTSYQDYPLNIADKLSQIPAWRGQLLLSANRLRTVNPVPMIMNHINVLEGAGAQWQSLYTILTELFVNALDHGVLGLNSDLKNSAEGFSLYFKEREKRLTELTTGFVDIAVDYFPLSVGGKFIVTIKDSGPGFDVITMFKKQHLKSETELLYSGRGILLVENLCDTLEYKEKGTLVEAVFIWN